MREPFGGENGHRASDPTQVPFPLSVLLSRRLPTRLARCRRGDDRIEGEPLARRRSWFDPDWRTWAPPRSRAVISKRLAIQEFLGAEPTKQGHSQEHHAKTLAPLGERHVTCSQGRISPKGAGARNPHQERHDNGAR